MQWGDEMCMVSAKVVHDEDWTTCLKDSDPRDISLSNISSSILSPEYDQEALIVRCSDKDAYSDLLRNLKAHPMVHNVETLYTSDVHRINYFLLSVVARSDASIFSLIDKFHCIMISSKYSRGMEHWKFMCLRHYAGEVATNIRAMATVKKFELGAVSPLTLENLMGGEDILSPREFSSTLVAHNMGYFDYPRRADLAGVSRELQLSKGTTHEYLRRGVLKIIRKEFAFIEDRNDQRDSARRDAYPPYE